MWDVVGRMGAHTCVLHICVTHTGTRVYTSGNIAITEWFEPWGVQRILTYTTSSHQQWEEVTCSHQQLEEVKWQNNFGMTDGYF